MTIYFADLWTGYGAARCRLDRALTFVISSDGTFHVLGVRHMMHMRIPSYTCTLHTCSTCIATGLHVCPMSLCTCTSHNASTSKRKSTVTCKHAIAILVQAMSS